MRSDGYVLMSGVELAQRGSSYPPEWASYQVFEPHYTGDPNEGLKVLPSPEATTAETEKGFRINFSCLTALRGDGIRVTSCRKRGTIYAFSILERERIRWMPIVGRRADAAGLPFTGELKTDG